MKWICEEMKEILGSLIIITLMSISVGCLDNIEEGECFIYVMYDNPRGVNTTVFVDDELILDLRNTTFNIFPPVSDIVEIDKSDEYSIHVIEGNLSTLKVIKDKWDHKTSYISVFISEDEIRIEIKDSLPDFE
jgi:hypothetical protein